MIKLYQEQKKLILFLGTIVVLYIGWYFLYESWIKPHDYVDTWLSEKVAAAGAWALGLLGYAAGAEGKLILVNNKPTVYIGNPCNGLELMAYFVGLISAFPGDWRKKLFFIPLGVVSIYLINVLRVAALSINHIYSHGSVEFNHKYTFSFVVYAFIFALWMLWVKKYSNLGDQEEQTVTGKPATA